MEIDESWPTVKRLFRSSFSSSFHYAVSTIAEDGNPHVTPIGSLILGAPGQGFYFEEFPTQLPRNLEINPHVCILAVNSSRWYWLRSLLRGKFEDPPSVRLYGKAGKIRDASDKEIALWRKRVKAVRFTKGHALIWRNMKKVRDIEFTKIEPVNIGQMTADL